MSDFGKELLESAQEALDIAQGKAAPPKAVAAEAIDVAAIRKRLRLSQNKFAERFGLSVATVRDWEQKRRVPDRIAANLLRVIDHAPETVQRALEKAH
ncbi:NadS family protein [Pelagibacterium sediminicola]|uniref:NadS family protein n=1 Tax=Pelagibacterium sediminicola TaxID=2248761 RepID=UPI000E315AC8|nr:NadS family protein [Pelagibacterium sediminicola]